MININPLEKVSALAFGSMINPKATTVPRWQYADFIVKKLYERVKHLSLNDLFASEVVQFSSTGYSGGKRQGSSLFNHFPSS